MPCARKGRQVQALSGEADSRYRYARGNWELELSANHVKTPSVGFLLEIDGRMKTEFATREGAERGGLELKQRFPALQVRIYDAATQTRAEVQI